jgi:hypothetical protein
MAHAHSKPDTGHNRAATSLSERLSSLLSDETNILVSSLSRYARVISVLCGIIAYLIGVAAVVLLASYYHSKPVGYEGFYFTDSFPIGGSSQDGEQLRYNHPYVIPSFKFFELLVVGTAAGAIGIKVRRLRRRRSRRRRSVLTPAIGLIACLLAWFASIIYVAQYILSL